jgi:hypothetical protein
MKELQHFGIGDQGGQPRRLCSAPGRTARDLHQVGVAIAGRELDQAEPVAMGVETHGLGIDRHDRAERQVRGKIAAVKADRH